MSTVAPGVAFVGRGRELDALAAHLAAQGRPSGGVLLISGPAGVGKTRLVDEAVRRAAGPAVVRGYCPAETAPAPVAVARRAEAGRRRNRPRNRYRGGRGEIRLVRCTRPDE